MLSAIVYSGEVKLLLEPEAHYSQFSRFMQKYGGLVPDQE